MSLELDDALRPIEPRKHTVDETSRLETAQTRHADREQLLHRHGWLGYRIRQRSARLGLLRARRPVFTGIDAAADQQQEGQRCRQQSRAARDAPKWHVKLPSSVPE
ncbi:hypothetical protein [Pseudoclavibacter sp. RFBG4]|uniref:hypothetical protein n=1 Tax=Pseudoclavibacter sp. RFBG4 TaxID=2080575 RepID=UPI0011B0AC85|nr:hypothetical protein [Pseudoclavibacter sp. RFBG4]